MPFMTSNLAIGTRNLLRTTRLSSVAMRLLRSRNYEALADAMMRAVSPGNCVWDVGANVEFMRVSSRTLLALPDMSMRSNPAKRPAK